MSRGFVPTRAALAAASGASDFQLVTYKSYKSQKKNTENKTKTNMDDTVDKTDDRKGIDIKRARREIIKFGMTAFTSQEQQEAKVALAISLGAKPHRKEYKNYKLILEQKKKQKILEDSQKKLQQAGKDGLGKSIAKKKFVDNKHKSKGDLLMAYGKPTLQKSNNAKNKKMR
ncbi:uncharacterized protein LOC143911851 [Arctopsyche grandis]|uniref:uncharacterized protein LOC143911851 n=1 Tax=Arctopsyche grandis TaxID=121162 RepID=UPI00406D72E6